jgi:hypothetical protein
VYSAGQREAIRSLLAEVLTPKAHETFYEKNVSDVLKHVRQRALQIPYLGPR